MRHCLLSCAVVAALACAAAGAPPSARAALVAQPPVLDGLLDDACWKEASVQGGFAVYGAPDQRVDDTTFRLVYDDAWLYLGVECRNPKISAIQPKARGHDKGVTSDESVEVFLEPDTGGRLYLHYGLSFANARDEKRVAGVEREVVWDMPWRSATRTSQQGWTAEAAIPWSAMSSYGAISKLKINVARNKRVPLIDSNLVVISESMERSSWSPVVKTFHEIESFGPVEGIAADLKVRVPLLARIDAARVGRYYVKDGRSFFDVEIDVKGYGRQKGDVVAVALDRPVTGRPSEAARTVSLDGPGAALATIPVAVDAPCSRAVEAQLRDPARNEVLDSLPIEDLAALNIMTAFLDRNYYTGEAAAVAVCQIGLPAEQLKGLSLEARAPNGANLAAEPAPTQSARLAIPLQSLPVGASAVEIALLSRDGAPFFKTSLQLIKRAPNPGREWKIDHVRRVVLNNGKPFFPFGMVMGGVKPDDKEAFKRLAVNNLNTALVWARMTPDGLAEYNRNAAAHGLYVISHPDECAEKIEWEITARYSGDLLEKVKRVTEGSSLNHLKAVMLLPVPIPERNAIYAEFYQKNIGRLMQGVAKVKDFENLAGYFIMDEPMSAQQFDEYKFGQDYYARIHQADGYHPVMVNYSSFIPDGDHYVDWCDILATDPYWYPPAASDTRSTPNHVSKICWMTNQRALARRQAVWQVLVAPRWSRTFKRPLTQAEIRVQTYLALIHKTAGILYFNYAGMREADWVTVRNLGQEIKALEPFLTGLEAPQQITCRRALLEKPGDKPDFKDAPFNPLKEEYPDVQAAALASPDGGRVLLAANTRHYPVACAFEIAGLRKAESFFGGASVSADGKPWQDKLEPYATRAWRLDLTRADAPLAVTILQTSLKSDLPNPETVLPFAWRQGRRNAMPNPSFEDATSEGCPDYCLLSAGATLQEGEALFGKRCVRIEKKEGGGYESLHMHCDPQELRPQTYTLSVYLKGSRDGMDAWLRCQQLNPEKRYGENLNIRLTKEWKRYSITGVLGAKISEAKYEVRLREDGVMWVDGVQLERGGEPTEFEP